MRFGSLFSGIGGIDKGLEDAGHHVIFQAESDKWRRRVLASHWPGVPCYEDVRDLHGQRLVGGGGHGAADAGRGRPAEHGTVDLLCGGFPCQDLSVAGRRRGLAGERSGLFFEYARVADELLRPGGWILIENVPGLLSSNSGRDYAVLLATLAELGFHDLAWRVLDSRHYGVPQRRRRVYILARRCARGDRARAVLLEPTSRAGDPQTRREAGARTAGASASGPLTRRYGKGVNTTVDDGAVVIAAPLSHGSNPNSNAAGRRREDDVNLVASAITASAGHHGHSSPRGDGSDNLVAGFAQNQRGELVETAYAHQLTGGGGKPGEGYAAARTPQGVRRLTPVECERLQGFPDHWTAIDGAETPDSPRYAALGDAVTVNVAAWIGRRLARYAT